MAPKSEELTMATCSSTTDGEASSISNNLLLGRQVIYCGACGMPPEYCEYGPDFETHCDPWLRKHHPDLHEELAPKRTVVVRSSTSKSKGSSSSSEGNKPAKPDKPWTTQERLTAFYQKYVPEKVGDVPSLLEKYAGKEDNLFHALTKKYGPEPLDPYFSDDEDDEDDDSEGPGSDVDEQQQAENDKTTKRRGVSAKKGKDASGTSGGAGGGDAIRVLIQKVAQKKKRNLTIVTGMETVPGVKLKEVSKAFSKRFAGSSSVKDTATGAKEIILQGDHMYDVAEMIVDKFAVPESCVWLDIEGDVVPLR